MKTYEVSLSPAAQDDLNAIYDWIADHGNPVTAQDFIRRIRSSFEALQHFPARGTRHDDITLGLRTYGFERRVTITFRIDDNIVTIMRVLYGGRDLAGAFQP